MPPHKRRNLKDYIFARDGNKCLKCGETKNLTVDHIVPTSKGGTDEEDNLQTLCQGCNRVKGDRIQSWRMNVKVVGKIDIEPDRKNAKVIYSLYTKKCDEFDRLYLKTSLLEKQIDQYEQVLKKLPIFVKWIFKIKL